MKFVTLVFHFMVVKLGLIICYQDFEKTKSVFDAIPNERDHFVSCYVY
jgi:hypothetical protein